MKIMISGGLGYVGGRLSEYLAGQGHEVVALSRQALNLKEVKWPQGMHILHPDDVMAKPEVLKGVDVFIHLAALNENDCVTQPFKAIDVNIGQTLQWLDLTHKAGINKFIYFSTAHVYAKPLSGYYDESTLTQPVHPYAITHKCAEDYVLSYSAEKGMSNLVVRLTNSFGGPAFPTADRWTLLVNDLCQSAVKTGTMTLLSDGLQLRDFVCLHDVCRGVEHLIKHKVNKDDNGVFNLGAGHSMSVWDMACMIQKTAEIHLKKPIALQRKEPIAYEKKPTLEIGTKKLFDTGFVLRNDIDSEIVSTLKYFQG